MYALPYEYDHNAPEPTEWHSFLQRVWKRDEQSKRLLQEWFGYCLLAEQPYEKIMALIGLKRSGKGTMLRMIEAMLGGENVFNGTRDSLDNRFGMADSEGKAALIFADIKLDKRCTHATELLKSASSTDGIRLERKYHDSFRSIINGKIILASNDELVLPDDSGTIADRLLFLHLPHSYFGHEDIHLLSKLKRELASILNWSLEGLIRLQARGKFEEPDRSKKLRKTMIETISPMREFIANRYEGMDNTTPDDDLGEGNGYVICDNFYKEFVCFCEHNGHDVPPKNRTIALIRTVLPDVEDGQKKIDKINHKIYKYIREIPDPELEEEAERIERETYV
jgi:putative DNA primase/helicase